MRNYIAVLAVCCGVGAWISGCGGGASGRELSSGARVVSEEPVRETAGRREETDFETPEFVECVSEAQNYYMITDEKESLVPCLALFDDGTFGFTYDVLSSYYPHGVWRKEGDRLIAVTDDGKYTYVFQSDNGRYIFLQEESSDAALTDRGIGAAITDRAVFAPEKPLKDLKEMTAVVKEIEKDCFLVSSRSDQYPGVYYVYFGGNDISRVNAGDEIRILWDGSVLETEPGQIYADMIQTGE